MRLAQLRLLALDIDGTLVSEDAERESDAPSERLVTCLQCLHDKHDVTICLLTGRMEEPALSFARQFGTSVDFLSVVDGKSTLRMQDEIVISRLDAGPKVADVQQLIETVRSSDSNGDVSFTLLSNGKYFRDRPHATWAWNRWSKTIPFYHQIEFVDDLVVTLQSPGFKCDGPVYMYRGDTGPDLEALLPMLTGCQVLSPELLHKFHVINGADMFQFNAKNSDKSAALQQLCSELDILSDEVLGLGNDLNDVKMLNWVGQGVAMKDSALDKVDFGFRVTAHSVKEDGAADYLEQILAKLQEQGLLASSRL